MKIILASTSITRQNLFRNAGVAFDIDKPLVDESALIAKHPEWHPQEIASRLALAKAQDVSRRNPGSLTIGADQTLIFDGVCYGKPGTISDARQQLTSLRGSSHELRSAVSISLNGGEQWSFVASANLTMRQFSDHFLDHYLACVGEDVKTSVGGYKIEGIGLQLFEVIEGSYDTILGLPLLPLLDYLRSQGLILS